MRVAVVLILGFLYLCEGALARTPKMIPLMPPPERGGVWSELRQQSTDPSKSIKNVLIPTVELGAIASPNFSFEDFLGMQVLMGGRLSVSLPSTLDTFNLKPSIGYFRSRHSNALETSVQQIFEAGLTIEYSWFTNVSFQSFIGVANRLDYWTSSSQGQSQNSTQASLRYRVGPSLGVLIQLSSGLKLSTQLECTFAFTRPVNTFGGLTTGLAFEL